MKDIIITIAPFAQGLTVGIIGATVINWGIFIALIVNAAAKQKTKDAVRSLAKEVAK